MKLKYNLLIATISLISFAACNDFLDQKPETILSDEQVFSDPVMINTVLANFYGRVTWGQNVANYGVYYFFDEAGVCSQIDYVKNMSDDLFRIYDYTFIRNINQFLKSLRATTVLTDEDKRPIEGEARFLRAWCYFHMVRGLGGVPIVNDEVFEYTPGMDVTTLQYPRATEAAAYDYIINECKEIAQMLSDEKQINSARANKWAALMLQARAAVYAGSLATYNNRMDNPIKLVGEEVGIPVSRAQGYYETALEAADEVINGGVFILQDKRPDDKGLNFYEAVCVKDGNTEVIWSRDYKYPGQTHGFTQANIPVSHTEEQNVSYMGALVNLAEEYEPIHTTTPGLGSKFETKESDGTYKFYDSVDDPFKDRDPRLWGTVIYPYATFRGVPVPLQTGQLIKDEAGEWTILTGELNSRDENGILITSINGPRQSYDPYMNKTGFYVRKFLDEATGSGTSGKGSEMWNPYFRISEAYLIAAEACFELENGRATEYINPVRERAGVQPLQTVTFENIVHEYRVEFAFEDHRYWDLKRWRLSHQLWDGNDQSQTARHRRLWPYLVVAPGDPNDGKWVFMEDFYFLAPYGRYFDLKNYYNFFDVTLLSENPKLVLNPYQ